MDGFSRENTYADLISPFARSPRPSTLHRRLWLAPSIDPRQPERAARESRGHLILTTSCLSLVQTTGPGRGFGPLGNLARCIVRSEWRRLGRRSQISPKLATSRPSLSTF